jgi:hypothetical protein
MERPAWHGQGSGLRSPPAVRIPPLTPPPSFHAGARPIVGVDGTSTMELGLGRGPRAQPPWKLGRGWGGQEGNEDGWRWALTALADGGGWLQVRGGGWLYRFGAIERGGVTRSIGRDESVRESWHFHAFPRLGARNWERPWGTCGRAGSESFPVYGL